MTDAPAFTFLTVQDVLSLHEDAINTWGGTHGIRDGVAAAAAFLFVNGIDLLDQDEGGESVLAKAMIDVAERRWPDPRRALADVLRRPSGAR